MPKKKYSDQDIEEVVSFFSFFENTESFDNTLVDVFGKDDLEKETSAEEAFETLQKLICNPNEFKNKIKEGLDKIPSKYKSDNIKPFLESLTITCFHYLVAKLGYFKDFYGNKKYSLKLFIKDVNKNDFKTFSSDRKFIKKLLSPQKNVDPTSAMMKVFADKIRTGISAEPASQKGHLPKKDEGDKDLEKIFADKVSKYDVYGSKDLEHMTTFAKKKLAAFIDQEREILKDINKIDAFISSKLPEDMKQQEDESIFSEIINSLGKVKTQLVDYYINKLMHPYPEKEEPMLKPSGPVLEEESTAKMSYDDYKTKKGDHGSKCKTKKDDIQNNLRLRLEETINKTDPKGITKEETAFLKKFKNRVYIFLKKLGKKLNIISSKALTKAGWRVRKKKTKRTSKFFPDR